MLGYLKRDGMPELNGLGGDEFNLGPGGGKHTVHEYAPEETVFRTRTSIPTIPAQPARTSARG
jgi:hypothetical protein